MKNSLLKTEESLATATEAADGAKERETSLRTRADRLQDELSGLRRDSDRETACLKVRLYIRLRNTVETRDQEHPWDQLFYAGLNCEVVLFLGPYF